MGLSGIEVVWDTRDKEGSVRPDISIIVPVYNVEDYVEICLCSILSAGAGLSVEIIIINDGSKDASHEIVTAFLRKRNPPRTVYIRQANAGVSAARNIGVITSLGRYISFLDSDDFLSGGVIRQAFQFAEDNNCEVVLGRSLIFDKNTNHVSPFYDDWVWCRLLAGSRSRVISRHEDPALFLLEPNPCYRLIKRELFFGGGLKFPEGLFFEDPPVHYKMLALASRVGLIELPYYWYCVGRTGKTTADRSLRRYHILDVASETFLDLSTMGLSATEGAAVIYGLTRIAWWCGNMVQPEYRQDYFSKACKTFSMLAPKSWAAIYTRQNLPDDLLYLVGAALLNGDIERLVDLSYGRRQPLRSAYLLLSSGGKHVIMGRIKKLASRYNQRIRRLC